MKHIKVFLDTCIFPVDDFLQLSGEDIAYTYSTVTEREVAAGNMQSTLNHSSLERTMEVGVWGESCWDNAVYGSDVTPLEEILSIITNNSFPKAKHRANLGKGEQNQLRDAMILENAIREESDYFVTDDKRAFISKDEKTRSILEERFGIKILTRTEFTNFLQHYHD